MYAHIYYLLSSHSAGYQCVQSQLVNIVRTLKVTNHASKALTLHYKQEEWLEMTANPTEDELVTLALVRMKDNPSQYDKFLNMLRAIEGLDLIVNAITGSHGKVDLLLTQCNIRHAI